MKRNRWRGLRSKIIAWSFVPTAIILSAVAWFTFYSYQEVLGDLTMKQDWAVVHARADQAHEALAGLINSRIRSIGLEIDIDPSLAPEVRARNILERAPGIEIFDGGIYFVDLDGRVFKTHPEQPELMGEDWSETPQFRFARDHPPGSAPLTDLRTIGTKESGIVCVIWPMHNQEGEFVGAGYYCPSIEPTGHNVLYELLNGPSLGRNMYIVDGNQRIVFSPDPAQSGKDLSGEASVQQLLQSQTMSTRFQRGTEDMLISYDPFATVIDERNSWLFISEQSWSEVMQPTLPYRQLLLVLLALGVAVPVLVTAYGVRHITDPIQKLIRASEQVTAGQFGHRIEVRTADEIETLADQFNLMSARLDDSYSLLEKKVADRTRELAILNSIISVASHSLEVSEILGDALNKTVEQMGFEAGAAFQLGPDGRKPHLAIHRGFEPTAALDLAGTELIAGHVDAADRQASVTTFEVGDLQEEGLRSQIDRAGVRRLFRVPLRTKTRTLGFFLLGRHSLSPCSSEELSLLTSIGAQVGVAMENAHLYEQAEKTATTAERSRLARELHDAVTQTLFSANLIGDVLPQIWERNPEEGMRSLEELRQLTRGALAEMRTMLLEMRPESLERSDLRALLTQLADAFVGRVRVPIALVIQGDGELSHEVKVVFYRVAQEALNNIARHSGARQVSLHLEGRPDRLQMSIKDDGLGFEPDTISPDHLGIAIMRERANSIGACLKMETRLGQGTRVELDWRPPRKEGVDEHA